MAIQAVYDQPSTQGQIVFPHETSPYSALWWTAQAITNIPADSVGWLVAQGWQITDIVYDETTVPKTPYYAMGRNSLQNWYILQSLLNSWTVAYNDARDVNNYRYNNIITSWTDLLTTSHFQFEAEVDEQNTHAAVYLGNLDAYMTQIDTLVAANSEAIDAAVAAVVPLLADTNDLMTVHGPEYDALIDSLLADYDAYALDFSSILNLLPTDYEFYLSQFNPVLDLLSPDHALHTTTATAFLDDLGATELARINEEFAARLATQLQQLVDRGLYSAALATDVEERNARDRDEQVQALNDRLMREKWENQHRLYGQQVEMRSRTLDGKDRVYERQNSMRSRVLDGKDRLYERKVAMRGSTMDGKNRLYTLRNELLKYRIAQTLQNAESALAHKHKAIVELMSAYAARLEGLKGVHAENMQILAYQLDVRNKLMIGLYGFVERREDVGPSINDLAQITTGLADAGGGWLTP